MIVRIEIPSKRIFSRHFLLTFLVNVEKLIIYLSSIFQVKFTLSLNTYLAPQTYPLLLSYDHKRIY